jgi:hypothetical protein
MKISWKFNFYDSVQFHNMEISWKYYGNIMKISWKFNFYDSVQFHSIGGICSKFLDIMKFYGINI